MCTVTFIPKTDGYLLGMNRDDLFTRADTLPPAITRKGAQLGIYPLERCGGTWIAANGAGLSFALLNWNRRAGEKLRSRGEIIPAVLAAASLTEADELLRPESLAGLLPFRLVGVSTVEHSVCEWRWDNVIIRLEFPWKVRHWFSSGLSDEEAAVRRGAVCRDALSEPDAHSLPWLRRLHRSHSPAPGPFSICAHRESAGTLSYTEIIAASGTLRMNHSAASPCSDSIPTSVTIPLAQSSPAA